jgi:D-alanine-D-alanine ligase
VLVDEVAELEAVRTGQVAPGQGTARVIAALESLGYEPVELALRPGKTEEWLSRLLADDFGFAFNLCETVGGVAQGEHLAAAAVELLRLPMTGASAETLLFCLHKDRCSAILRANGVTVPEWKVVRRSDPRPDDWSHYPAIVKPVADDASNGVHSNSVVNSKQELVEAIKRVHVTWDGALVQRYIAGREINLAIVGRHLLPPAEIDFSTLPEDVPPIVSYEAKWVYGSAEDLGTRPVCPAPLPARQAEGLQRLAARAWRLMSGRGYGRVDIRLTEDDVPYVIDINPNPDLSVDAGLARQARVAGWSYDELIRRIVDDALGRNGDGSRPAGDWVFVEPRLEPVGEPE